MNRRSFLTRLGVAAVGAAALAIEDPERLLWVPGAKTIIDLGATKQVLPATDREVLEQGRAVFLGRGPLAPRLTPRELNAHDKKLFGLDGPRDITLTLGGQRFNGEATTFKFKDDQLVSLHSEAELTKLDATFAHPGEIERARRELAARRRG